jgi:hypothetical protein
MHDTFMKNPRDLTWLGSAFFLGIVFCYFLMAGTSINPGSVTTNQPQAGSITQFWTKQTAAPRLPAPLEIYLESLPMNWKTQPPAVWDRPTLETYGQPLLDFRYKLPE